MSENVVEVSERRDPAEAQLGGWKKLLRQVELLLWEQRRLAVAAEGLEVWAASVAGAETEQEEAAWTPESGVSPQEEVQTEEDLSEEERRIQA